jgi:hypothetical protein
MWLKKGVDEERPFQALGDDFQSFSWEWPAYWERGIKIVKPLARSSADRNKTKKGNIKQGENKEERKNLWMLEV